MIDRRLLVSGYLDHAAKEAVVATDPNGLVGLAANGHRGHCIQGHRLLGESGGVAAGDGHIGEGQSFVGLVVAGLEIQERVVGSGVERDPDDHGGRNGEVLPALPPKITADLATQHTHQVTSWTGCGAVLWRSDTMRPSRSSTTRSAMPAMAELCVTSTTVRPSSAV